MELWILRCLTFVFLITIVILIFRQRRKTSALMNILDVLRDMERGEEKRRLLAKDSSALSEICYAINSITARQSTRIDVLRQSEREYRKLLAGLSHDLRTPLSSLIGYLDAVHNNLVSGAEREEYLEIARNKAYDLKTCVDVLFEWFKLDAGERIYHFVPTDIFEHTRDLIIDWIPVLEKKGVAYEIDIPDAECVCNLDYRSYNRIFENLLQNILYHSGASRIELCMINQENAVTVVLSDNGKGIAEKDIPFIFDRLYMTNTARSPSGSGLGLAIAKDLMKAHGGSIGAQSVLNVKTTFTLTFPIE